MGWISDKLLSFIEGIAIKVKVWAWNKRVNRRFIKLHKKKMIDKIFYSMFGYIDSWSEWVEKIFNKRNKNERYKVNRKVFKNKRTKD